MYPNAHSIFQHGVQAEAFKEAARRLRGRSIMTATVDDDRLTLCLDDGTIFTYAPWNDYAEDSGVTLHFNGQEIPQRGEFIGPAKPPMTEEEWQTHLDTLGPFQRVMAIEMRRMYKDIAAQLNDTTVLLERLEDELPEPPS